MVFCLAVIGVTGRLVIRIYTRRRLFLDDAFLVFGMACLSAATVLCYRMVRTLCLIDALQRYPDIIIPVDQFKPLLHAMAIGVSVLCLTWTTTFVVKFSFLILFWHLLQRTSKRLKKYYWVVTGTCVISWMFVICEPFVLCHYFGVDTGGLILRRLSAWAHHVFSEMFLERSVSTQCRSNRFDHRFGYRHWHYE